MNRKPHLHNGKAMVDLDKNLLVEKFFLVVVSQQMMDWQGLVSTSNTTITSKDAIASELSICNGQVWTLTFGCLKMAYLQDRRS